jgi:uncharacterized repeat protein (TIGR01451 family)
MMRFAPVVLVALLAPLHAAGQAALLTPTGSDPGSLSMMDDAAAMVPITDVFPDGIKIGSETYTSMSISTNGYVTFGHSYAGYNPQGIAGYSLGPIVAPQFDDLDPSKGGTVTYQQSAGDGRDYVVATWQNVHPYSSAVMAGSASPGNTFQVVLRATERASTDLDIEIRYVELSWAGSSAWPTAGWSVGDQVTYAELPQSGSSDFLAVLSGSNTGSSGIYRWQVVDGTIQTVPTVTATAAATDIGGTGATGGGTVSSSGGPTVTAWGVAYDTSGSPTVADATAPAAEAAGTGSFSATLTGLEPATTYYVRAYATNALGTSYGPQVSFTTALILSQTITFPSFDGGERYGEGPLVLAATASSGLPVSYTSSDAEVAVIEGDTLHITGAGSVEIAASQAGNDGYEPADDVVQVLSVGRRVVQGSFSVAPIKIYDGGTATDVTDLRLEGVLAADSGLVALLGGPAHYETPDVGDDKQVQLDTVTITGARSAHYTLAGVTSVQAHVHAGPPVQVTLAGPNSVVAGQPSGTLTLTIRDAYGNPTAVTTSTVFDVVSDHGLGGVAFGPDHTLTLATGSSEVGFTYLSEGIGTGRHRLTATGVSGVSELVGADAVHTLQVVSDGVASFRITTPAGGALGDQFLDSLVVVHITALDAHGNAADDFTGRVSLESNGILTEGGGETASFVRGVLEAHTVVFGATGPVTLTATGPDGSGAGSTASFHVIRPVPSLEVTLNVSDDTPALGSLITLELTVTNHGTALAPNVVVQNPLAGQTRLRAESVDADTGAVDADPGPWRVGDLAPGQRAKLLIRARVVTPQAPPQSP